MLAFFSYIIVQQVQQVKETIYGSIFEFIEGETK